MVFIADSDGSDVIVLVHRRGERIHRNVGIERRDISDFEGELIGDVEGDDAILDRDVLRGDRDEGIVEHLGEEDRLSAGIDRRVDDRVGLGIERTRRDKAVLVCHVVGKIGHLTVFHLDIVVAGVGDVAGNRRGGTLGLIALLVDILGQRALDGKLVRLKLDEDVVHGRLRFRLWRGGRDRRRRGIFGTGVGTRWRLGSGRRLGTGKSRRGSDGTRWRGRFRRGARNILATCEETDQREESEEFLLHKCCSPFKMPKI